MRATEHAVTEFDCEPCLAAGGGRTDEVSSSGRAEPHAPALRHG